MLIGKYYTDIEKSEQFGNYYDKYACMCGMIYLAKEWQLGGYARLKELFDQGYHGFARKCI